MLASCTTSFSVYVSLSKNSSYSALPNFLSESGCKGTTNFSFLQAFSELFFKKAKSFRISRQCENSYTLLYI